MAFEDVLSVICQPYGPGFNIKTWFYMYGDFYVKDEMVVRLSDL